MSKRKTEDEIHKAFHDDKWVPWMIVAKWLDVGRKGFYALVRQGLPHVKLSPRGRRFRKSDVEAWLSNNAK